MITLPNDKVICLLICTRFIFLDELEEILFFARNDSESMDIFQSA
jgi:hypothetical protein